MSKGGVPPPALPHPTGGGGSGGPNHLTRLERTLLGGPRCVPSKSRSPQHDRLEDHTVTTDERVYSSEGECDMFFFFPTHGWNYQQLQGHNPKQPKACPVLSLLLRVLPISITISVQIMPGLTGEARWLSLGLVCLCASVVL